MSYKIVCVKMFVIYVFYFSKVKLMSYKIICLKKRKRLTTADLSPMRKNGALAGMAQLVGALSID